MNETAFSNNQPCQCFLCHCSLARHDYLMNMNSENDIIILEQGILFESHILERNDFSNNA